MICGDRSDRHPIVQGVAIPVDFERFIPPDLQLAVDYYPNYLRQGGTWKIQPYLCDIVRQFAHYEAAHGRAGNWGGFEQVKYKTLGQFFAHVGTNRALEMMSQGKEIFSRIVGMDELEP